MTLIWFEEYGLVPYQYQSRLNIKPASYALGLTLGVVPLANFHRLELQV